MLDNITGSLIIVWLMFAGLWVLYVVAEELKTKLLKNPFKKSKRKAKSSCYFGVGDV